MSKPSTMQIAFIGDREDNRDAWAAAMRLICADAASLRTYASVDDFEASMRNWTPHVVFVDFFIMGRYGTEVIEFLRKNIGSSVVIITHSSMHAANNGMLEWTGSADGAEFHGADAAIAKTKGVTPSPTLTERFVSFEDFCQFVETCRSQIKSE